MSTPFDISARLVIQSSNIGQVTQQLQTALNKVGAVAGQGAASNLSTRQVVNLTKKLGPLGAQFDKTRASATKFASTMRITAQQLKTVVATVDQATQSVAKLNAGMRAASSAKIKTPTQSGGGGGGNIVAHNKKIADSVRRVSNEYEEFGRQIVITGKRFATYVVAATAFYSIASALRDGVKEAIDFQHQMVRLSQTTGKSLGGLRGIRKEIDALSAGFGISSRDLSEVSVVLAQAGFSAKETGEALRALGKTTLSPSFENITKTTEGAIAAMRQFGIETSRLEGVLGSINTVAAKFAVESNDIITAIQKAGGTFATLDKGLKPGEQSLREFIAIFSSVRDTTRESADTIATGLRTIFARVQSPKVIDFLKQYDIQLQEVTDGQKLFVGGLESVLEISNKLKNVNTRSADFAAIVQQLGGQRQVSKTIPLFTQADKIREAVRIANTGQNSLEENQKTAQQSLQVQLNKTRENFLKLIRDLGDTKSFQILTQTVLGLTNNLIKLADVFKEIIPLATAFFASKAAYAIIGSGPKAGGVLTGISKELFRPGHGPPYRRSSGGIIPGYGDHDTVPAMLTPGEFVLNKKAVNRIGVGNLKKWNSGISRYADGGPVRNEDGFFVFPNEESRESRIKNKFYRQQQKRLKYLRESGHSLSYSIREARRNAYDDSHFNVYLKYLARGKSEGQAGRNAEKFLEKHLGPRDLRKPALGQFNHTRRKHYGANYGDYVDYGDVDFVPSGSFPTLAKVTPIKPQQQGHIIGSQHRPKDMRYKSLSPELTINYTPDEVPPLSPKLATPTSQQHGNILESQHINFTPDELKELEDEQRKLTIKKSRVQAASSVRAKNAKINATTSPEKTLTPPVVPSLSSTVNLDSFRDSQSLKGKTKAELRQELLKLAKSTGVDPKKILDTAQIKLLDKNDKSKYGGISAGKFYHGTAKKQIGINPDVATFASLQHEFAHAVDFRLGGGKQFASNIKGTVQHQLAQLYRPILEKQLREKGFSEEKIKAGLKNHEVFARLAQSQSPEVLKNLLFKQNISPSDLKAHFDKTITGSQKRLPHYDISGGIGLNPPLGGTGNQKLLPHYPAPLQMTEFDSLPKSKSRFTTNPLGTTRDNNSTSSYGFTRVSAQRGRRISAGQYQTEVLRDLHRTHGLSYAAKNVNKEARKRLIRAVATQFQDSGLSPSDAVKKAITYVDKNKLSDVLVGANGQGLGFNDNITNGLDTSLTNRTRQSFASGASGFRSLRARFNRVNNSRLIKGVGAFGSSPIGLAALYGGTALAGQALGSIDSNDRKSRTKGAVGDVLTSTLGGAAFGTVGGPWGILGGAIAGLAVGLVSMQKKLKEAKVNDAIEDFGKALGKINKDLEKNGKADFSKLNPDEFLEQRHAAGLANHYLYSTAESYGEGVRNFDKTNGDLPKEGLRAISLYIEKNADKLFANSGDTVASQSKTAYGRLLGAKGGKFDSLINLFNRIDKGTNYNQVTKGLIESEAYKRALIELNQQLDFNIQKFTDLGSVVDTAVDATTKFDNRLAALGDSTTLRSSYTGVLGSPGGINVSQFNEAATSAGGLFGKQGDELAEAAITFNKFTRELPEILRNIEETPQNKFADVLSQNKSFQNLGDGAFAQRIKNYIIATAHEHQNIGKDAQGNAVDLTKNLLSKFDDAAKVLDHAAKQFSEQQNRFSQGLAEVGGARIAIGNQRDTIGGLQLERARTKAGFSGSDVGFADLAAPFLSRQSRLAGGLAGNSGAIAAQIARNTAERTSIGGLANPTKVQIEQFHELGRASAELRAALEDLADTSKTNAAAQERLSQIESERSDRLGFAKNIFTADASGQRKIVQGIHLARFAVGGGDVNRLNADQRQNVVSTLEGFGNTSNLFGSGKNGQQLLEGLLEKFGGKLPQNLEQERQKQQQTILENIDKAIQAQKDAIGLAENETSTKLDLIRATFDEFVQKLKELSPVAGKVAGFAQGGSIFSPRGTDTVPAMLTPGEFVMRRDAVQRIGVGQLQAMNNGYAKGGLVYLAKGGLPYNGLNKFPATPLNEAEKARNKRIAGTSNAFSFNPNRNDGTPIIGAFKDYSQLAKAKATTEEQIISPTFGSSEGPDFSDRGKYFYQLYKNQLSRNGRKYKEYQAAKREFRIERRSLAAAPNEEIREVIRAAMTEQATGNRPNFAKIKQIHKGESRKQIAQAYRKEKDEFKAFNQTKKELAGKTYAIKDILERRPSDHIPFLSSEARERVAANKAKREAAKASSQGMADQIVSARSAARERKSAENAEKINQRIAELKAAEQAKRENKVAHFATGGIVGGASPAPSHDSFLTQLGRAIQELSNSPLVEALKNFPHEISLKADHKVEVIFNGAEILQKLVPEIQQIAVDKTKEALRKMLRDKFPEAGTNV